MTPLLIELMGCMLIKEVCTVMYLRTAQCHRSAAKLDHGPMAPTVAYNVSILNSYPCQLTCIQV